MMKPMLIWIIAAAVVIIAAVLIYNQWNAPRPLDARVSDSMEELKDGNLGKAVDEMGNTTYGEKATSEMKDAATSVSATLHDAGNDVKSSVSGTF